jgi:succinyl-CoA synthetase beta subunit
VLKVVSEHILHKGDAGGVVLSIRSRAEAEKAFRSVRAGSEAFAAAHGLPAEDPRALVTRMADPPLAEVLVGAYRDASLGPVLTLGSGGAWVELLEDVTHRVLPVTPADIGEMLDELRLRLLLRGYRGAPAADVTGIVAVAASLAACMESEDDVREIEINPLFVFADRVEPVDARVVLTVR